VNRAWIVYDADGRIVEVGSVPGEVWDMWAAASETVTRREIATDLLGLFQLPGGYFVVEELPAEMAHERRGQVLGRTFHGEYICRRKV